MMRDGTLVIGADESQVQANGVDVRARKFVEVRNGDFYYQSTGKNSAPTYLLGPDQITKTGVILEPHGYYIANIFEAVDLPDDVMALFFARSSFLRNGVLMQTAVWDAGYSGYGQVPVIPFIRLHLDLSVPIGQLVFFQLNDETNDPYNGQYQEAIDEIVAGYRRTTLPAINEQEVIV